MKFTALVALVVLAGCHDVVETTDIAYDTRFEHTRMDMYAPDDGADLRPAVIAIHGGAWASGIGGERDQFADHARRLADAGYVSFNLSYRLVGYDDDGSFPHAIQDVICALAYVRSHADEYGIDPDRIASYGYSAGGHLASMLGVGTQGPLVTPDCAAMREEPNLDGVAPVAAVVSGAGVQDFSLLPQVTPVTNFLHGTCKREPENCAAASPINYVAPGAPPFLFIHGDDDWFVDFDHTLEMRDKLVAVGTPARIMRVPGGGHLLNESAAGDVWNLGLSVDSPAAWMVTLDFLDHMIGDER